MAVWLRSELDDCRIIFDRLRESARVSPEVRAQFAILQDLKKKGPPAYLQAMPLRFFSYSVKGRRDPETGGRPRAACKSVPGP